MSTEEDFETSALEFIAKNLAVPMHDVSKQFDVPEEEVQEKLQPLVVRSFVKAQNAGGALVYSITANGIKELERSVRTGLAAYF
jgi:predicted ArsR family transcriptional regulator